MMLKGSRAEVPILVECPADHTVVTESNPKHKKQTLTEHKYYCISLQ